MITRSVSLFFLGILLFATSWALPEQPDAKTVLITAVKNFVSTSLDVPKDQVVLRPFHPSFSPPNCAEKLEVGFFEKSENSLLIECKSLAWKYYVSVEVTKIQDVPVYLESFKRGHPLKSSDLILERTESKFTSPILDRKTLGLVVLRRNVKPGQFALAGDVEKAVIVHKLIRDVEAKATLRPSYVKKIIVAESRTVSNQAFPTKLISGSAAARQLRAGRILSRTDFNERKNAVFVTENIRYGSLVDNTNTETRITNERVPANSISNLHSLGRVQAVRLLRAGTILRHSDLRAAPLVRAGETTILNIKKGALNIEVTLIALENGLIGDLIKLKNPDSGENVLARVSGVGKVTLPN